MEFFSASRASGSADQSFHEPARPEMYRKLQVFSRKQCFGSGMDPDSIRSVDPNPGEQKWPTKMEKVKKFNGLKCWMFSFEPSPIAWTSFMKA